MPSARRPLWLNLFFLSAASLAFEIDLTRLFSVAQFYHFAFMVVSIALLGFGASGTFLALFPSLQEGAPEERLTQLSFATGFSTLISFLLINWLPFDSFSIAWDPKQAGILILHYAALATPFFFSGMALGFLLNAFPQWAGVTYAVNLLGSSAGCLIALLAPPRLGGEGTVSLSIALATLAGLALIFHRRRPASPLVLATLALLAFSFVDLGLRLDGRDSLLELRISPYKSLSYAMQNPQASLIHRRWNAFSRVDVVRSPGIHTVPGLSYRYLEPLPSLDGLLVDGDDLSPVVQSTKELTFVDYLPNALAFHLRPKASSLILDPRGGLDLHMALALSSGPITAIETNPLIVEAVPVYREPHVQVHAESFRSYLRRTPGKYDVIVLSLPSSFHPVRSGAYSLGEDYRYTLEAFQDILAHLNPGGLLVATRWLQESPSEDLRLFALALTTLESNRARPELQMAAFRGFNTATVLVKESPFITEELSSIRAFLAERAFDLSYAPGIQPGETNRYNILPESRYYQAYMHLMSSDPRDDFYRLYAYDVRPPTDDHPFFGHYFKWGQAPQVLAELGKTWQPFGGAGYFVILALLVLAVVMAAALILLPVARQRQTNRSAGSPFRPRDLLYFGLLGFAFLFVEIPLLQQFILYLGQPAYAFTVVLFSLLFFSGLGSRLSNRIPPAPSLLALVILILTAPLLLPLFFASTLGLPLGIRLVLAALIIFPLGFLMGIPFPAGIRMRLHGKTGAGEGSIPWIWAVNGAASVIASILSALLALTFGFSWVLRVGALCYVGALITVWAGSDSARRPRR